MGSVGNQNPWQTYDTYKDCSQGICSIYCPQWCYIIFPPPPPFSLSDNDDGGSGTDFSPLIIAVIGILASAFILVSYYTVISKYCRRRSTSSGHHGESSLQEWTNESWQQGAAGAGGGLDESIIKSITVWKYKKSDGSSSAVDAATDCSVCLTEFQENESLRLLPKCNHAFHIPCIDTWLKSNATCPLCRANIFQPPPLPPVNQETPLSVQEYQYRSNDSVLMVQELEQEEAVIEVRENVATRNHNNNNMVEIGDGIQPIRRSASLNLNSSSSSSSSLCQNGIIMSIADILQINNEDDEIRDIEIKKIGILNLIRSPLAFNRSISTGRFMFITSSYENGRTSLIPN